VPDPCQLAAPVGPSSARHGKRCRQRPKCSHWL